MNVKLKNDNNQLFFIAACADLKEPGVQVTFNKKTAPTRSAHFLLHKALPR